MNRIEAEYLYNTLRKLPERNYAKDHGFDEWWAWFNSVKKCEPREYVAPGITITER